MQDRRTASEPSYIVTHKAGDHVFREAEAGDAMFIIQKGQVEILKVVGRREQRLALLEEGDFFGEMAILEDLPRAASARAVTDCELMRIDSSTFDNMVRHNPEIPIRMLRKLSARLRERAELWATGFEAAPAAPAGSAAPAPAAAGRGPGPRFEQPERKVVYPLVGEGETFVGRVDPATGFRPQVDLKAVDDHRSTSRRHARVIGRGGAFFLREEIGVSNGTFVNGARVPTGVEVEIHDGDEVRFGLVKLVFRAR